MSTPKRPGAYPSPAQQGRPNSSQATGQPIVAGGGDEDRITNITSYLTTIGTPDGATPILYNGDRNWAKVTLTLDTAGPVVVGTMQDLAPITSGKGWPLTTDQPIEFTIAKGSRLYIFSTALNRVKVQIAPLPWLESITALAHGILAELRGIRRAGGM